ncbi:MAG: BA14K family protein [Hyphomicrobiales bacterium]
MIKGLGLSVAAFLSFAPVGHAADYVQGGQPVQQGWSLGQPEYDPSAGYYREGAYEYRAWRNTFQSLPQYGEYQYWLRRDNVYLPGQLIPGNPKPGLPVPAATYGYYDAEGYQYFDRYENPGGPLHPEAEADNAAWLDYCRSKYRSFNPATGLYRSTSGELKPCR